MEGRFNTPDPSLNSANPSDPGTINRYAYVAGDPISRRDPRGLEFELTCAGEDGDASDPGCDAGGGGGGGCFLACSPDPDPGSGDPSPQQPVAPPPSAQGFLGADESDANSDLANVKCYSLFGFTSAKAAQSAFAGIRFNYASYGKLSVTGGGPTVGTPPPANTAGYGTININTDYHWGNLSQVSTQQGGTFNYLNVINRAYHTALNSEQLGTLIILHEFGHQQTNPKQPSDLENNAEKIAIAINCIH